MTTADADIESVYHARRSPARRAVLFDLDDTLFDHEESARGALRILQGRFACFARLTPADFERAHAELLERLHRRVIAGTVGIDDARVERFRLLFEAAGERDDGARAGEAARCYREAYVSARRPMAGATALLRTLYGRVRIGVVSNNLLEEQQQKLEYCGLASYVSVLVVSEEVRVSKPHPEIFHVALDRLGCRAIEAIMVGDSWVNDVAGALAAGIPAIWFNRRGDTSPDPGLSVPELRSLEPASAAARAILDVTLPPRRAHRD
jgi:putative hydrolase of the HAD superfamily